MNSLLNDLKLVKLLFYLPSTWLATQLVSRSHFSHFFLLASPRRNIFLLFPGVFRDERRILCTWWRLAVASCCLLFSFDSSSWVPELFKRLFLTFQLSSTLKKGSRNVSLLRLFPLTNKQKLKILQHLFRYKYTGQTRCWWKTAFSPVFVRADDYGGVWWDGCVVWRRENVCGDGARVELSSALLFWTRHTAALTLNASPPFARWILS